MRWHEIAGGISPERAEELEDEVTKYAQALSRLGGAANEIEALRNEVNAASSRAENARRRLIEACRPYGADDPGAAMEQVRQRIATGRARAHAVGPRRGRARALGARGAGRPPVRRDRRGADDGHRHPARHRRG